MHSFLGTERGAQLQSLLHRVDLSARRRVPRIALSATLGDFTAAAGFLRPGDGAQVALIASTEAGGEIRLQLRGYLDQATPPPAGQEPADRAAIADHLFQTLRFTDNLPFLGDLEPHIRFATGEQPHHIVIVYLAQVRERSALLAARTRSGRGLYMRITCEPGKPPRREYTRDNRAGPVTDQGRWVPRWGDTTSA